MVIALLSILRVTGLAGRRNRSHQISLTLPDALATRTPCYPIHDPHHLLFHVSNSSAK